MQELCGRLKSEEDADIAAKATGVGNFVDILYSQRKHGAYTVQDRGKVLIWDVENINGAIRSDLANLRVLLDRLPVSAPSQ